jgi:hypothetical protein
MPFRHVVCGNGDHGAARLSTFEARLPEGKIDRRETYVLGCTGHPSRHSIVKSRGVRSELAQMR